MEEVKRGYPRLAKVMGPYTGMSVFKRFAELNARNLLYMQAEILFLEQYLNGLAALDNKSAHICERAYAERALSMAGQTRMGVRSNGVRCSRSEES
jgi:hypothetical protein